MTKPSLAVLLLLACSAPACSNDANSNPLPPIPQSRLRSCAASKPRALAAAYVDGQPSPEVKALGSKAIDGKCSLRVAKESCEVSLIAQPAGSTALTFDWQRPPAEIASSTGGPSIACGSSAEQCPIFGLVRAAHWRPTGSGLMKARSFGHSHLRRRS